MYASFANTGKELSANACYSRRNKVFECLSINGQSRGLREEPPKTARGRPNRDARGGEASPFGKFVDYFSK